MKFVIDLISDTWNSYSGILHPAVIWVKIFPAVWHIIRAKLVVVADIPDNKLHNYLGFDVEISDDAIYVNRNEGNNDNDKNRDNDDELDDTLLYRCPPCQCPKCYGSQPTQCSQGRDCFLSQVRSTYVRLGSGFALFTIYLMYQRPRNRINRS